LNRDLHFANQQRVLIMRWSFKIGRILGIDVYIHFTFLLLLGFVGLAHWLSDRTLATAATGVIFFALIFLCVLLHEYGHALAARGYGIQTRDITLLPIGGLARLERMPEKPSQELWVAVAGPLVNLVIAAGLLVGLVATGSWEPLSSLDTTRGHLAERLLAVNVFLAVFNFLPAFPMDGGRVLRSVLAMRMEYARATRIAANIGRGMAVLFAFAGLFISPMLLLIGFFVWFGASQEAAAVEFKSSLAGALVRDAMMREFHSLAPQNTLGEAVQLLLAGSQQAFPVVANGQVLGLLRHTDLIQALRERGESCQVGDIMERDFSVVEAEETLDSALQRVGADRGMVFPVLRSGNLVGLLTLENIGEYFMVRAALESRARQAATRPARRVPPVLAPPLPAAGKTPGSH
jgi:Zn-dependent protease